MAEKEFPPSDLRLQRLRQEGIVPFSPLLSSACALSVGIGLLAVIVLSVRTGFNDLMRLAAQYWSWDSLKESPAVGMQALPQVNQLFAPLAFVVGGIAVVVFIVVLAGMIQNGFLFTNKTLFQFRAPLSLNSFREIPNRALATCGMLGILIVGVAALVYSAILVVQAFFTPLVTDLARDKIRVLLHVVTNQRLLVTGELLTQIFFILLVLLGMLGVVAKVVTVQRFRHAHRMTREEVEAELRETEPSPEMRERQRQQD